MIKHLLCTTVLLFGATALRADVFSFSYAGVNVSAGGTLTATALGVGTYLITDITGVRKDTGSQTALSGSGKLGVLYYDPSASKNPLLDATGISFTVKGLGLDTVLYANNIYQEIIGLPITPSSLAVTTTNKLTSFTVARLPEPSTLLLLLTMGLGVLVLARKLPSKTPSQR